MIHIFVGTKAQLIKMAPIMQELERRNMAYNFIDAGQHAALTGALIEQFEIKSPDVHLRNSTESITTIFQAMRWTAKSLWQILFRRKEVFERLFKGESGVCLIHGDTLTTLLSLLFARRCGVTVAHVEAGLRSYRLLDPFPEEIIRLISMRLSHQLYTPSAWAAENLEKMGFAEKMVNVGSNTGVDAVRFALQKGDKKNRPTNPYVIFTCHRVETIFSNGRMQMIVELIEKISKNRQLLFAIHEPTQRRLEKYGLMRRLSQNKNVQLLPLQPYIHFINLIAGADFVVTDGGSIQEESYFLGIPCLIMRGTTERQEGIGDNAYLANFNWTEINNFLESLPFETTAVVHEPIFPSAKIVDAIAQWEGEPA